MNPKETLNKVKTLLGLEVKLEQMKLDNGTIIEAESFEPQQDVFIVTEDERVPMPIGEYVLEDGKMVVIAEEGVISEIKAAVEEVEETEDAPVEEPEMAAEPTAKKVVESISKEMFFSEIEKLRNEITELKNAKTELAKEVKEVELAEEVKPIVHNPEAKTERKLNLYQQNRVQTTKDIVFNKLFKK